MQDRDPDFQRILGQRVRSLRSHAGLTQDDLSRQCAIYRTYLARIEAGAANPTVQVIAALATGLGVPVHMLFLEVDAQQANPPRR